MKANNFKWLGIPIKYILSFLIALISLPLIAQSKDIIQGQNDFKNQDLRYNLSIQKNDTLIVQDLLKRADKKFFSSQDIDSMYYFIRSALALSKKINYLTGITKSYGHLGFNYYVNNHQDSARHYLRLAINEATKMHDRRKLTLYYLWYGWTFSSVSTDLDSAMQMFKISYQYAIEAKDTSLLQSTVILP